jgi:hypothetical protein
LRNASGGVDPESPSPIRGERKKSSRIGFRGSVNSSVVDSSASTFRIALSLGFLYHCFTCRRDGREPHGSRLAFTRPARPIASQGFTPWSRQPSTQHRPSRLLSGFSPHLLWTGLHRLMTPHKDVLENYFTDRRMKVVNNWFSIDFREV